MLPHKQIRKSVGALRPRKVEMRKESLIQEDRQPPATQGSPEPRVLVGGPPRTWIDYREQIYMYRFVFL